MDVLEEEVVVQWWSWYIHVEAEEKLLASLSFASARGGGERKFRGCSILQLLQW